MKKNHFPDISVFICDGSKCGKHKDFRKSLKNEIKNLETAQNIEMFKIECSSRCKNAPVLCVQPLNKWFSDCSEKNIPEIIDDIKRAV